MKKIFTIISLCFATAGYAQLTFDTSKPIDTLIQDFVGSGVTISNVTFTGGPVSIGSFSGSSSLGTQQGIVFSTGNIDSNIAMPAIQFMGTALSAAGDADLNALVGLMPTFDAAVLEFDFVATNTTLLFDYVFASEEYNEFVSSSFNDVFAFFISGPGITGQQNIALIPSTTTAVAINNVNNGTNGTGPCMNCAYFHDNTNDTTVAFDGFTTPLTATYTITPGQTYHLKLAVADVADGIFDTGVFLQKYSLRTVNPAAVSDNVLDKTNVFFYDNNLHINLTSNALPHCTVYNINGSKVFDAQLNDLNNTISFDKYTSGVYSVVLQLDGNTVVKKVVKN